tara:strand:+ start:59 stop:619 length:561 start_codon:yes stop_codon:yes gene_type:complete
MRKDILDDLYGMHLKKISKEKEVFLRKNLALEYAPYKEYIAKIPDHLLNYGYRYSVRVIYKKDDPINSYNQTWEVSLNDNETAPISDKKYTVHPNLYAEVADIIEREQEIRQEREEMDNFISRTFDRTTGSKQIRQMWPESLHKYLPKEPDPVKRQRNSKDKEDLPTITAPLQLNTRLVNNLLEEK